jgi:hypothetical protein
MPRNDLLSLTPDDLAALTNRGTVKRALRELETAEATFTLTETDAGEMTIEWSDDARCIFPAGKTASDARCTCPSTTLCRHIIRSILAYQQQSTATQAEPPAPAGPWDPGQFTDEQLAQQFKKNVLSAAQTRFQQGLLIELVRSSKPTARFHQLACSLRFMVPNDLRYTHCDCAEAPPCSHVPLAVWAFRRLAADQPVGIVSTQDSDLPAPIDLLDAGENLLSELLDDGISSLSPTWKDRAIRLEAALSDADLIWPAQVLADIAHQYERYASHDARFSPQRVAELVGEWLIRADAIRHQTRAVPQLLIRGSSSDRTTDIGSARYVGLGCGAMQDRVGVTLTAYLQDVDSGSVVAVSRDFANPARDSKDPPRDFSQLAAGPLFRAISMAALGAGQLLLQGGKRAPDHQLFVGRAKASLNPQSYAWESLRAPLLAEDFAEIRARLASLPPSSLRPRYLAENLHVVPIAKVEQFQFDDANQSIDIAVHDTRGELAVIHHPYLSRAREGSEALLAALSDTSRRLCFVAAQVANTSDCLLLHPITLVFEGGATRTGIQPWIDRHTQTSAARTPPQFETPDPSADPIHAYPAELLNHLGELLLLGLRRADARVARSWAQLAQHGESIGYDRLVHPAAALAQELAGKQSTTTWTPNKARPSALTLAVYARMAADLYQ